MSAEEEVALSKSARKRANQKARAAAEAGEAEAPAPPAAAAKEKAAPKAKASQPAEPAQPKAKGKAKAETAPAPKAEPKAKGKAEPKPAAAPKEEAAPKAKGAAKSKAKAKAKPEPEAPPQKEEPEVFIEYDDGKGGEWEQATGLTKKQTRRKERLEEEKKEEQQMKVAGVAKAGAHQHIPGLAPAEVQLAQAKGKAKAEPKAAPVGSVAVVSAAAVATKEKEPEKPAVVDNNVTSTLKVPEGKVGRVVGPKGANIILIKEKTGVKTIDIAGDICTIVGLPETVPLAEAAVRQLIDKGYMALSFDDFAEDGVQVHPSVYPDLIGSKGAVIQVIKKEAGVEIDIPAVPKDASKNPKKYRVGLAGSKAGVEKGKEIINSLVMYGHHEITHPGFEHQEMEVEEWRYRFLIGSKGSEMRHIQNNYHVKVNIPREFSSNDKVVIIGEPRNIERAVKYIEKLMYDADQPKGRGADEKATDNWGDEGDEEAWMAPYMYRRK